MESTPSDQAWSVIDKILEKKMASRYAEKVWIPRAEASPHCLKALGRFGPKKLEILQSFRPDVCAFETQGFEVTQSAPVESFDLVLMVPTRQRTESLALIAEGLMHLQPDGRLLFSCSNTQGAGGYITRLKEVFPDLETESARKCRWVILSTPPVEHLPILERWFEAAMPAQVPGSELVSLPGLYGWNKLDRGSELLLSTIPPLGGRVADFGAGYGFLAHHVLEKNLEISEIHLVEADARALECARFNLRIFTARSHFHWLDIAASEFEKQLKNLDVVIMNPPFHDGSIVDQALGRIFIERAAHCLTPSGRLFMVANSFLNYEDILMRHFRKVSRVLEKDGFKVIHAER